MYWLDLLYQCIPTVPLSGSHKYSLEKIWEPFLYSANGFYPPLVYFLGCYKIKMIGRGMVLERKLKGELHGYANYLKILLVMDTLDWTNLSQLTCPSSKNDNIIIFNIISCLFLYYKGWWRRGGTNPLLLCRTPYLPLNPLVLLMMTYQKT